MESNKKMNDQRNKCIAHQKKLIKMFEDCVVKTKEKYGKTDPEHCKHSIKQARETIERLEEQLRELEGGAADASN